MMQNMMNMMQAQQMGSDFGSDDGSASMMSGMVPNMNGMNPHSGGMNPPSGGMNAPGMMDNGAAPSPSLIESMMHHAMTPSSWGMGGGVDSPSMSATETPPPDQFPGTRSMTPSAFGMAMPPPSPQMNQMGGFWPNSPQNNAQNFGMNQMQQPNMHPMNHMQQNMNPMNSQQMQQNMQMFNQMNSQQGFMPNQQNMNNQTRI